MSTDRAKAYTEAGVDIQAGNDLVARIKHLVQRTHTKGAGPPCHSYRGQGLPCARRGSPPGRRHHDRGEQLRHRSSKVAGQAAKESALWKACCGHG